MLFVLHVFGATIIRTCCNWTAILCCMLLSQCDLRRGRLNHMIFCCRQWSGVNGVSFFAPQIFAGVNALGSGNEGSLIAAVIVNGVQLIATIITVFIVDRVGRRTLLISGSCLGFAAEIAVAIVFAVAAGTNAISLPYGASIAAIVLVRVSPCSPLLCACMLCRHQGKCFHAQATKALCCTHQVWITLLHFMGTNPQSPRCFVYPQSFHAVLCACGLPCSCLL